MTKTANHLIARQWVIGFIYTALFLFSIGVYEYRLNEIKQEMQATKDVVYEQGITVAFEWPEVELK